MQNKVALITGGTGGIGAAICTALAKEGCKIVTNYRNKDKAEQWRVQFEAAGFEAALYPVDVTDFDACADMIKDVNDTLGGVDILINNAGITKDTRFAKMSREDWDKVMDVNLNGMFNVTRQVVGGMAGKRWGRIVNIASINGQKGQFGQSNYAASKAGMHGFTMSLAQELAAKGVTVNTVSPGYIATEMVMAVPENIREAIIGQIPIRRLGLPEEVAALVCFLCTNAAAFATGADFSMNGGQHMM
ncbi:MAG: acetoacetyl-CoA reductase [Candidatus Eutrophobiaceae bacterium]